jgi:uncharacterized protein YabN with tetrapyrrole methylase and pyrophosphatase domain
MTEIDPSDVPGRYGSLTIVGTGISLLGQFTLEARRHVESADKVLYVVADPLTAAYLLNLNASAESLFRFYEVGKDRIETYLDMVEYVLGFVRQGLSVCAAFYGHPGVFALPSHVAVRRARAEGYRAEMLPGISAEDCLFADLGIDPGARGCQSFEATDFLVYHRIFDPRSCLVLWQVGAIGEIGYMTEYRLRNIDVLAETLCQSYPADHEVIIYEAALYPVCEPKVQRLRLRDLESATITALSTLAVPPTSSGAPDLDMYDRLGIRRSYVETVTGLKRLMG